MTDDKERAARSQALHLAVQTSQPTHPSDKAGETDLLRRANAFADFLMSRPELVVGGEAMSISLPDDLSLKSPRD